MDNQIYSEFLNDAMELYFHPNDEMSLHGLIQSQTEKDAKDFLEKAFIELFEFRAQVGEALKKADLHEAIGGVAL